MLKGKVVVVSIIYPLKMFEKLKRVKTGRGDCTLNEKALNCCWVRVSLKMT